MHRRSVSGMSIGVLILAGALAMSLTTWGCAGKGPGQASTVSEEGLNTVRLESDPDGNQNTHPARLTPQEIGTLLRGVRVWEQRNVIHRLFTGPAPKTRAFRDDEIEFLAPALSKALAQAAPDQRVHFRISHADPQGAEETTSGWIFVREPNLHLVLGEVHDKHAPGPDISKYDRQMPDVPEVSGAFHVTFEPEEYLVAVKSGGKWFAPDQREELIIRYRDALPLLPAHPLNEPGGRKPTP
jgi:hypothetical protein